MNGRGLVETLDDHAARRSSRRCVIFSVVHVCCSPASGPSELVYWMYIGGFGTSFSWQIHAHAGRPADSGRSCAPRFPRGWD